MENMEKQNEIDELFEQFEFPEYSSETKEVKRRKYLIVTTGQQGILFDKTVSNTAFYIYIILRASWKKDNIHEISTDTLMQSANLKDARTLKDILKYFKKYNYLISDDDFSRIPKIITIQMQTEKQLYSENQTWEQLDWETLQKLLRLNIDHKLKHHALRLFCLYWATYDPKLGYSFVAQTSRANDKQTMFDMIPIKPALVKQINDLLQANGLLIVKQFNKQFYNYNKGNNIYIPSNIIYWKHKSKNKE